MAILHICDGCREPIEGEAVKIGFVVRRDYCDTCRPIAAEYGAEIDELHTKHASRVQAGLAAIRARFRKKLAALPDYIEAQGDG